MVERTLAIIKPDVVERNLQTEAVKDIKKDFQVVQQKDYTFSQKDAELFYGIHKDKPFFHDLVKNITKGPCVLLILQGENIVDKYRAKIGPTNPQSASPGHLRHKYGISIDFNSFHGSDSVDNAKKEIEQLFN